MHSWNQQYYYISVAPSVSHSLLRLNPKPFFSIVLDLVDPWTLQGSLWSQWIPTVSTVAVCIFEVYPLLQTGMFKRIINTSQTSSVGPVHAGNSFWLLSFAVSLAIHSVSAWFYKTVSEHSMMSTPPSLHPVKADVPELLHFAWGIVSGRGQCRRASLWLDVAQVQTRANLWEEGEWGWGDGPKRHLTLSLVMSGQDHLSEGGFKEEV